MQTIRHKKLWVRWSNVGFYGHGHVESFFYKYICMIFIVDSNHKERTKANRDFITANNQGERD